MKNKSNDRVTLESCKKQNSMQHLKGGSETFFRHLSDITVLSVVVS